jgi:hypothetical protein
LLTCLPPLARCSSGGSPRASFGNRAQDLRASRERSGQAPKNSFPEAGAVELISADI